MEAIPFGSKPKDAAQAVFIILAFLDLAGLWLAILADTGATLLVIANSLRLLAPPKQ
jgi:Cd2+/Zn2+-exporting ATPase